MQESINLANKHPSLNHYRLQGSYFILSLSGVNKIIQVYGISLLYGLSTSLISRIKVLGACMGETERHHEPSKGSFMIHPLGIFHEWSA